jgi:hypothetical protein
MLPTAKCCTKITNEILSGAEAEMQNRNDRGSILLREATQKNERPALVPGHALGVPYSGLHGTVRPTCQVRTPDITPAFEPGTNRPTAYLREAAREAKGITGQIGTFEERGLETGMKFASEAQQPRIRKMIRSATEEVG